MSTGIDGLDRTIEKTNIWLNEVMEALGTHDKQRAYHALRAVLATVRRNISPDELNDVRAVLPEEIKDLWGVVL